MTPEPSADPIRILLADDEHLVRGAIAALLALEADLAVVAQAATGAQALAMARALRPEVAVLDLQLPDIDGVTVAKTLHIELPTCRTMIVTSHGLPGHLKRALAVGVRGFLPKTVSAEILAAVVRTVHSGGRYVDPQLAAEAISAGASPLTAREAHVLELAADPGRLAGMTRLQLRRRQVGHMVAHGIEHGVDAATNKLGESFGLVGVQQQVHQREEVALAR